MTSRSLRGALALTVVPAIALSACSAGSGGSGSSSASSATSGAASGASDAAITLGLVAEPASLDFTTTDGAAAPQALLGNVYETLVVVDDSGAFKPALATEWKVSDDRKNYTFTLDDKATFSDGAKLTADDVVASIQGVKTKWTTALKKQMDVVASAKAVDPTHVEVVLTQPSNSWLYAMTTRVGAIMPKAATDLATKPVGSGPYTFTGWDRGDKITMTRNESYRGAKPHFKTVTLKYFKDATALNNAMLSKSIDVVTTVQAPESLGQFTSNSAFQVVEGTTNGEVLLSFNNSKPLFKDVAVRQALRQAIDHKTLVDTCWAGKGTLLGSMVPPTDPWYEDLTSVAPYDKAKATEALKRAGVAGQTIRLRIPTLPYATSCGPVVKNMLEQAGMKVQLDQLEFPAAWLTSVFKGGDYDMSIVAHVEPRDIGNIFGNPDYYLHVNDPQLQADLKAADTGAEAEQVASMKKVARRVSEQAYGDVLFLLPNLMVAKKGITGLPKNSVREGLDLAALSGS